GGRGGRGGGRGGRPQGAGGDDAAVAGAARGVDHEQRKVLDGRGIVKPVVHDDDACAGGNGSALDAVPRHDGRRRAREQERLVAHVVPPIARRGGPDGTRKAPAVATAEEGRSPARPRPPCRRRPPRR